MFGTQRDSYEAFCDPGMEAYSGMIICYTRDASRSRTHHVRHVFAGEWSGPDGELPPLAAAKTFTIVEMVWIGD